MYSLAKKCIIGIALAATIWLAWPVRDSAIVEPPSQVSHSSGSVTQRITASGNDKHVFQRTLSPFGIGPAAAPPSREMTIATLRKAFKDIKIRTPERYYKMGYKSLKELADRGDVYANLQLAMQYVFTAEALEYDPDYDFSVNPKVEAFKLFNNAALLGNTSAMVMLSTKLASTNPIDAYAWKAISDRLTGESQLDFYTRNHYDFQLNSAEIAKANTRSDEFMAQLLLQSRHPIPPE